MQSPRRPQPAPPPVDTPPPASGHGHGHTHGPGHTHGLPDPGRRSTRIRLAGVLGLTVVFMVIEAVGGWISGSLALMADAGHMLSDAAALGIALFAAWLGDRETSRRHTFGFRRAEFLAAWINSLGLVALAVWIVFEAVRRLDAPHPILGGVMLWVAAAGLVVNALAIYLLHGHGAADLNIRSAIWHVAGDLLGSAGALGAALVIQFTGWVPIDALLSMAIAGLIGVAGTRILFDSATLLLDRVPAAIDAGEVQRFLAADADVEEVCDLHIWGISSRETLLTAHLVVSPDSDRDEVLRRLLDALNNRYRLAHITLQLESEPHASCREVW